MSQRLEPLRISLLLQDQISQLEKYILQLKADLERSQQNEETLNMKIRDQGETMDSLQSEYSSATDTWRQEKSHLDKSLDKLKDEINVLTFEVSFSSVILTHICSLCCSKSPFLPQRSQMEKDLSTAFKVGKEKFEENVELQVRLVSISTILMHPFNSTIVCLWGEYLISFWCTQDEISHLQDSVSQLQEDLNSSTMAEQTLNKTLSEQKDEIMHHLSESMKLKMEMVQGEEAASELQAAVQCLKSEVRLLVF